MSDTRHPALVPIGAVTAAAVLGAGLVAAVRFVQPSDDAGPRPAAVVMPPPAGGVLPVAGATSSPGGRSRGAVTDRPVTVRYSFDAGVGQSLTDDQGGHPLRALGQNGGALSLVPRDSGLAVEYPRRCTLARERDCPRAILEGLRDDDLNPGARPLRYGASVRLTRADLADGANVLQKGYSVGGVSQYKLQVDHLKGHPSCVVTGRRGRIYRAEPAVDIADGAWHDLACGRTGNRLTVTVDGVQRASVAVPRSLSVANVEPLRIGGKGPNKGNDQYAGQIDNVFVEIS